MRGHCEGVSWVVRECFSLPCGMHAAVVGHFFGYPAKIAEDSRGWQSDWDEGAYTIACGACVSARALSISSFALLHPLTIPTSRQICSAHARGVKADQKKALTREAWRSADPSPESLS